MGEVTHIEVLGRGGDVLQRVRVDRLPATVGRAADNDVILDDPHVAAHHLSIERDDEGHVRIVDLGTVNGLFVAGRRERVKETSTLPGLRVRIGHTQLRLRGADEDLAPEMPVSKSNWLRHPVTLLFLVALVCGIHALDSYVGRYEEAKISTELGGYLLLFGIMIVWCGSWALGGRLFSGRANTVAHACIGWLAIATYFVLCVAIEYLAFALSSRWIDETAPLVLAAIVAVSIFYHLRLMSRQPKVVLGIAACIASAAIVGTRWFNLIEKDLDSTTKMSYLAVMKPPAFQLLPGQTPAAFFARSEELRSEVARMREDP